LVVSTPLKNDGVRQLDFFNSQYIGKHKNPWFQTTNQVMFAYRIWLTLDILQTTFLGRKSSIRRGAYFGAASLWLSNTRNILKPP